MFEHELIYNPEFGTEENVYPQLVYSFCSSKHPQSRDQLVRLLGVTQGITELANSLECYSVKWFKTGGSASAKFVIVAHLSQTIDSNWRSGFWFVGQIAASSFGTKIYPEAIYRLVIQTFTQHRLINGKIPYEPATEVDRYWSAFIEQLNTNLVSPNMAHLVLCPNSIRLASGLLSPTASDGIVKLQQKYGALDIMITTTEDGSAVYPGGLLDLATRRALQIWLNQCGVARPHKSSVASKSQPTSKNERENELASEGETYRNDASAPSDVIVEPDIKNDVDQKNKYSTENSEEEHRETQPAEIHQDNNHEDPSLENPRAKDSEAESKSWFSLPAMPSFPSISSFPPITMPSIAMPSIGMPSIAMPSITMPSMSITSSVTPFNVSWWSESEVSVVQDGFFIKSVKLYNLDSSPIYVTVWRYALYVYTVICSSPEESEAIEQRLTPLFESLALQMEGFSFAFAPPTRFYYLIHDPQKQTIVCTFNIHGITEILGCLIEFPEATQQVVRLGSTWLYFTTLKNGIRIVFGKKNVISGQNTTLLGALHTDVQQWLREFAHREGLSIDERL